MNLLLDTHLLLWAAAEPAKLSTTALSLIEDEDNLLYFSPASLWEVSIKHQLGRLDFTVDPKLLRRGLQDQGYRELLITGAHAVAVRDLPTLHRDPFDRLLVAQSLVEGITLLTADEIVARYPGPIRRV